jgi:hypothetical protein
VVAQHGQSVLTTFLTEDIIPYPFQGEGICGWQFSNNSYGEYSGTSLLV